MCSIGKSSSATPESDHVFPCGSLAKVQHGLSPHASLSIDACVIYLIRTGVRSIRSQAGACCLVEERAKDTAGRVVI